MKTKTITQFFDQEEKEVLRQTEELHKTLLHLRFEGKVLRGKNMKNAKRSLKSLAKLIRQHQKLQEKIIFPFLAVHIPKHERAIRFLRHDHRSIENKGRGLQTALRKLSNKIHNRSEDQKIHEAGMYFIGLLRHHLGLENKTIHKAFRGELREDEKAAVKNRISDWLRKEGKEDCSGCRK